MKKQMIRLLAVVMVVTVFSGCMSSDNTSEDSIEMGNTTSSSDETNMDAGSSDAHYEMDESDDTSDTYYESSERDEVVEVTEEMQSIDLSGESYEEITENDFITTEALSVSTFSIDVDTAAYSNIRNLINYGETPPADAVRIEEMINYFDYEYARPSEDEVLAVETAVGRCPWNDNAQLFMIGMQGYEIPEYRLPDNNIVFLLDVSGSMDGANKLPLLVDAFGILIEQFDSNDRVSVVVYAGSSGVVLDGVRGNHHDVIMEALEDLRAGGSTAGSDGIELAYEIAQDNYIEEGNNRVILATDGDFNVGLTNQVALESFIEGKRETGIYLSVLGFGRGNYMDDIAETLADKGNGNYSYIDSIEEAEKVFGKEFSGTLFTIANDVKIQVEFNNNLVYAYKLVGYENRVMANEDFNDDTKDAGELGSGHTVTALYEVILFDDVTLASNEVLSTVDVRFKRPGETDSTWYTYPVKLDEIESDVLHNQNLMWASSVAEFGLVLRNDGYIEFGRVNEIIDRIEDNYGIISDPYKNEFIELMETYKDLIH